MTKRIEELEAAPIVGNYEMDRHLLTECDTIIRDESRSTEERIRAIKLIDKIMGIESDDVTEDDIHEYFELN